ncbi:MAG: M67 family metallopeptidase [Candidatus Promineifilaceae bacterium]|nr:M67 family metallopeptidase [Candidatus Promineifilaceae bacterium]
METLILPAALRETMVAALRAALPAEGCGLLAGHGRRVERVYPVPNRLASPTAYEMAPAEQLAAMLDLEERGLKLLAIYHSHPQGPSFPSASDVAQAYYPEAVYIIVDFGPPRPVIGAFRIVGGSVHKVAVRSE